MKWLYQGEYLLLLTCGGGGGVLWDIFSYQDRLISCNDVNFTVTNTFLGTQKHVEAASQSLRLLFHNSAAGSGSPAVHSSARLVVHLSIVRPLG